MTLRQALALLLMSREYSLYSRTDFSGFQYHFIASFIGACILVVVCAVTWRIIVGAWK